MFLHVRHFVRYNRERFIECLWLEKECFYILFKIFLLLKFTCKYITIFNNSGKEAFIRLKQISLSCLIFLYNFCNIFIYLLQVFKISLKCFRDYYLHFLNSFRELINYLWNTWMSVRFPDIFVLSRYIWNTQNYF